MRYQLRCVPAAVVPLELKGVAYGLGAALGPLPWVIVVTAYALSLPLSLVYRQEVGLVAGAAGALVCAAAAAVAAAAAAAACAAPPALPAVPLLLPRTVQPTLAWPCSTAACLVALSYLAAACLLS